MSQPRYSTAQADDEAVRLQRRLHAIEQDFDLLEAYRKGESLSTLCERFRTTDADIARRVMFLTLELDSIAELNVKTHRRDRIQLLAHHIGGLSYDVALQRLREDRDRNDQRQQHVENRHSTSSVPSSSSSSRSHPSHARSASEPVQLSSHTRNPSSTDTRSHASAPPSRPPLRADIARQNYRAPAPLTASQTESLLFLVLTQGLPLAAVKARLNLQDRDERGIQEHLRREVDRRRREGLPVPGGEDWGTQQEGWYQIRLKPEDPVHGHSGVLGADGVCVCADCEAVKDVRIGHVGENVRMAGRAARGLLLGALTPRGGGIGGW